MVLKQTVVEERLKALDEVLSELRRHRNLVVADLQRSLATRWIVERGLIAAASLIFDVADHILAAHEGIYPSTYADSLHQLNQRSVISDVLYGELGGLAGLRNVLVHSYVKVDLHSLKQHMEQALSVFPRFAIEVLNWMQNELEKTAE